MADKSDAQPTASEFARSLVQKNSRDTLEAERKLLDEQIDKTVVALRTLMHRRVELEVGSRVMYGLDPAG